MGFIEKLPWFPSSPVPWRGCRAMDQPRWQAHFAQRFGQNAISVSRCVRVEGEGTIRWEALVKHETLGFNQRDLWFRVQWIGLREHLQETIDFHGGSDFLYLYGWVDPLYNSVFEHQNVQKIDLAPPHFVEKRCFFGTYIFQQAFCREHMFLDIWDGTAFCRV